MTRVFVIVFALFVCVSTFAQSSSPVTVTKDLQAMSIVSQVLAAYGGDTTVKQIADYTATGRIEFNWGNAPVVGTANILSRGLDEFRLDAVLPNGTRRWAVTSKGGVLETEDGQKSNIAYHNALMLGSLTFPVLRLAAAAGDPSRSINYLGMINNGSAYDIQVGAPPDTAADPDGMVTKARSVEYIIDAKTLLIIAVADKTFANDNAGETRDHMMWFSDYRTVNGIPVAFKVTELIGKATIWNLALSSISFNTGLSTTNFTF